MKIIVDDLLVAYERSGKGKIVLFLHGWGSDRKAFVQLTETLTDKYDCISVDLPGFGASDPPSKAWGLDDYAAFVRAFLAKIGVRQLYAVAGHSNGGAVAIRGLALGQLKAARLLLLGSAGIRTKHSARKLALRAVAKTGKIMVRPLPKKTRNKLRGKLYSSIGSEMLLIPHMQETFQKTIGQDVQKDAARISVPTLIIYGNQDDSTPPEDGQKFSKLIAGSKLEIIVDAGHFVHIDQPEKVQALVREFLQP